MEGLLQAIRSCRTITAPGPLATVTTSFEADNEDAVGDYGIDI